MKNKKFSPRLRHCEAKFTSRGNPYNLSANYYTIKLENFLSKLKKFSPLRKFTIIVHCSLLIINCFFFSACTKKEQPLQQAKIPPQSTLRLASFAPDSLNPYKTTNSSVQEILNLIYEPLIWCDSSMNPIPILAESWSATNNFTTWELKLRKNVQFHDGTNLAPNDVINSLNQAKIKYPHIFQDVSDFYTNGTNIIIKLKKAVPNFISLLEIPINKANEIGTGAYKIADTSSNKSMILAAFDNWWNIDRPLIKDIEIQFMPDKNTFFFAYNAGEIDMTTADLTDIGKYTAKSTSILMPSNKFTFIGLNSTRTTLFSPELKQAINSGLDKNKLSSTIFSGKVDVANTFINPKFAVSSPEYKNSFLDSKKSFEILKNYNGKKNFEIIVNQENENRVNTALFIANNLKEIGITANVKKLPFDTYTNNINTKNYDAFIGEILLTNNSMLKNENVFPISSDKMNELLENWQSQTTEAGLLGGYHYIEEQYLTDLPFISLFFETKTALYSEKIASAKEGQFSPAPHNPYLDINYWYFK